MDVRFHNLGQMYQTMFGLLHNLKGKNPTHWKWYPVRQPRSLKQNSAIIVSPMGEVTEVWAE